MVNSAGVGGRSNADTAAVSARLLAFCSRSNAAKPRRLLRVHEEHYARVSADRDASVGSLLAERERIQAELDAAFREVLDMSGMSDIELNRALMEARFGAGPKQAPRLSGRL
jgi:hypothetical protein